MAATTAPDTTGSTFDTWSNDTDDLVHWLWRHGVMTTHQLATLCDRRREPVQRKLKSLREHHGVVDRIQVGANTPYRWFLSAAGRDAFAGMPNPGPEMSPQRARNAFARHLLGVNELGVVLTVAARRRGDSFDAYHWRHEQQLPLGPRTSLRPDAIIDYELVAPGGIRPFNAFIELDRGTEPIDTLVAKIAAYNTYRTWCSPTPTNGTGSGRNRVADYDWTTRFTTFPSIYFVFDCPGAQRRMQSLAARTTNDPRLHNAFPALDVAMADLHSLAELGPFHPEAFIRIPNLERVPFAT